MKFIAVAAISMASLVAAQGAEEMPACAAPCLMKTVAAAGCQTNDIKCACTSAKVRAALPACVLAACPDTTAQLQFQRYSIGSCGSVGIKLEGAPAGAGDEAPAATRTEGGDMPAMPADAAAAPPADAAAAPPAAPDAASPDAAPQPSRAVAGDASAAGVGAPLASGEAGAMAPPLASGVAGGMTPPVQTGAASVKSISYAGIFAGIAALFAL